MSKIQDPFASSPTPNPAPPQNTTPSESESESKPKSTPEKPTKPTKDDSVNLSKNNFVLVNINDKIYHVKKGYESSFSPPSPEVEEKPKTARELRKEKRRR